MTRKEEIEIVRDYEKKIIENNPSAESYDYMNALIDDAERVDRRDRTMLDKVCEFIEKNFTETIVGNVISRHETTIKEVINDLRKAMVE